MARKLTKEQQEFAERNVGAAVNEAIMVSRRVDHDAIGDAMLSLVAAAFVYDPSRGIRESTLVKAAVRNNEIRHHRYRRGRWMTGDGGVNVVRFRQPVNLGHNAAMNHAKEIPTEPDDFDDIEEREAWLSKIKNGLSPGMWESLALRYGLDGHQPHTYRGIADAHGHGSVQAAEQRVARALRKARQILGIEPCQSSA